jgi:AcrR family transcriptional regulator
MIHTKVKILDAAERLIAEQGYAGTSLRQIISEAGVNVASVHYHFGSKEELLHELVNRKAGPVNEKRLALLDRYAAESGNSPVLIEKTLEAFLTPMVEVAGRNPQFVRVMGRIYAEGLLPAVLESNFKVVQLRFTAALRAALPDLTDEEFGARIQFMIGVIAHTMCSASGRGFETRVEWLIRFLAGGFKAPAMEEGGRK